MSNRSYKFEGEAFEVIETGCSLEVRLLDKEMEGGVYGSVVPSGTYQAPFSGRLLDASGKHVSSQLARSVEEALKIACGYLLSYRESDQKKACEQIQKFYGDLTELGS